MLEKQELFDILQKYDQSTIYENTNVHDDIINLLINKSDDILINILSKKLNVDNKEAVLILEDGILTSYPLLSGINKELADDFIFELKRKFDVTK